MWPNQQCSELVFCGFEEILNGKLLFCTLFVASIVKFLKHAHICFQEDPIKTYFDSKRDISFWKFLVFVTSTNNELSKLDLSLSICWMSFTNLGVNYSDVEVSCIFIHFHLVKKQKANEFLYLSRFYGCIYEIYV